MEVFGSAGASDGLEIGAVGFFGRRGSHSTQIGLLFGAVRLALRSQCAGEPRRLAMAPRGLTGLAFLGGVLTLADGTRLASWS